MAEQDKPVLQKRILAVREAPVEKGRSRFRAHVQLLMNPHANVDFILNSTVNLVRNHTFPELWDQQHGREPTQGNACEAKGRW